MTLALAQIVATPATELRHTDPPVSSRPVSYEEFFSQEQEAIAKEVLAKSEEVVAGYPPAITTDTKLSTFTDTATGMDGEITTDTVTSISTDTMTTITTTETMMTVEPVSPTEIATDPEVTGFTPK